jgi:hypothetical protein
MTPDTTRIPVHENVNKLRSKKTEHRTTLPLFSTQQSACAYASTNCCTRKYRILGGTNVATITTHSTIMFRI